MGRLPLLVAMALATNLSAIGNSGDTLLISGCYGPVRDVAEMGKVSPCAPQGRYRRPLLTPWYQAKTHN
jgi:hypothetical protein